MEGNNSSKSSLSINDSSTSLAFENGSPKHKRMRVSYSDIDKIDSPSSNKVVDKMFDDSSVW